MGYNTSQKTIEMIKSIKWLIGFVLWTLLYYILNYFVFKNIFNDTIMQLNGLSEGVLILSIIISFLTSFDTKILSKSNILTHLSIPLIIGTSKILEMLINLTIYIVNKFSYIVSAPTLGSVDFRFGLMQCKECPGDTIHGLVFAYFVVLAFIIMAIAFGHYGDLNERKYGYSDYCGCDYEGE